MCHKLCQKNMKKNIRANCYALGLQRARDRPKKNAVRVESFTARVGVSLLVFVPQKSNEIMAKKSSRHLLQSFERQEMQILKKYILQLCFSFSFTLEFHIDQQKTIRKLSEKTKILKKKWKLQTTFSVRLSAK